MAAPRLHAFVLSALLAGWLSLSATPASAAEAACCSPEQAREDLSVLFAGLEAAHPRLYFHLPREQALQQRQQLLAGFGQKQPVASLWRTLARLVAALGDGHTTLRLPFEAFEPPVGHGTYRFFPFPVRLLPGDQLEVLADPLQRGLSPGTRLLAVNGQPVTSLLAALRPFIAGELPAFREYELAHSFPFYLPLLGEPTADFTLDVLADGQPRHQSIEGTRTSEWQELGAAVDTLPEFAYRYRILPESGAALLDFRSCEDPERFAGFLAEMFSRLQQQGIGTLIVDLRRNGGGNSRLGEQLVQYLAPAPFRQYSRIDNKVSLLAQDEWGCKGKPSKRGNWPEICRAPRGSMLSEPGEFTDPLPANQRFGGKVYALIGPGTFSSAADLAVMLKDFHLATLVGEETGGLASSYGDYLEFNLPNSRFGVHVSYRFFVRPSGDTRPEGVKPDLAADATLYPDQDPALAKVLALIAH
ncbi:MAG: S41 family peptidase [Candidatus Sericytochromatia bacterium]